MEVLSTNKEAFAVEEVPTKESRTPSRLKIVLHHTLHEEMPFCSSITIDILAGSECSSGNIIWWQMTDVANYILWKVDGHLVPPVAPYAQLVGASHCRVAPSARTGLHNRPQTCGTVTSLEVCYSKFQAHLQSDTTSTLLQTSLSFV